MPISPLDDSPNSPLPHGFTEFRESPKISIDIDSGQVNITRVYDGVWANRFLFTQYLIGDTTEVDGNLTIIPPATDPDIPQALCNKVDIEGLLTIGKDSDNIITHSLARITASYALPNRNSPTGDDSTPDDPDNTFINIEESFDSSVEILHIDRIAPAYFTNGPFAISRVIDQDFKVIVPIINYKLRQPLILNPRWGDINNSLGSLNSKAFTTPSGHTAPIGTLLYLGPSGIVKREFGQITQSFIAYDITHSFSYRKHPWNLSPVQVSENGKMIIHWVQLFDVENDIEEQAYPNSHDHRLIFSQVEE